MEKHMAHLQQLKDYDETLAVEREEKARYEQERRKMEVNRISPNFHCPYAMYRNGCIMSWRTPQGLGSNEPVSV